MPPRNILAPKREVELKREQTVATIDPRRVMNRNLITGREPHPVGRMVCIKAGMRAVAWESMRAEMPMIKLCEVASPVHTLECQPHKISMRIIGRTQLLVYFPDMQLTTSPDFARSVAAGKPFIEAVAEWKPKPEKELEAPTTLIVEVKDDEDPRIDDPEYEWKLEMAAKVYRHLGWDFIKVIKSRDIEDVVISKAVRSIYLDHDATIGPADISTLNQLFGQRRLVALSDTIGALGGGFVGRAKAAAMHVRRFISIELGHGLRSDSIVRRITDGRAIFERRGRYKW